MRGDSGACTSSTTRRSSAATAAGWRSSIAAVVAQEVGEGDELVLIGIDSSPTMGVDHTCSSPTWGGEPNIGAQDDSALVEGRGIFVAEVHAELRERGLPIPRSTGIRHWFPGYDAAEEHARLQELLR